MRSNLAHPEAADGPQWPSRLGRALGITLVQVLAAIAVFLLSWILAANSTPDGAGGWAGLEYLIFGLLAAPAAAAVAGPIAAARMRMPWFGLYLLPVPVAVLVGVVADVPDGSAMRLGVLAFGAGNLLIALATVRLPRRPKRTATGFAGTPI
jgi:hypothetical protein